ncbi:hypothetical protein DV515_00019375, partial [Chloebia gouldiae]
SQKESCSSNTEEEEEDKVGGEKEIENDDANVEEDNKDGNEGCSSVDIKEEDNVVNEGKAGCNGAKDVVRNEEKWEEVSAPGNGKDKHNVEDKHNGAEEDKARKIKSNQGGLSVQRIQLPVMELEKGCWLISDLMAKLRDVFDQGLSQSFYPVPQEAIRVGSAFEGWSPWAEDSVYQVLVALSPPAGHAFHLELDTAGTPQRNFWVRVELLCTCPRGQLREDVLCFLHQPEQELRRKGEPSLLHTLCSGSYLDVQKTAQWFCRFVRVAWLLLPQSRHWRLTLLPSSRSCRFQLSKGQESFKAEMIFGVRRGDSDIFAGSPAAEVGTPSTTWPETCAVAEAKFFRHISRQAPRDSCHCKCLQLLSRCRLGVGLSSYTLKTVLMHLLSSVPLTRWRGRDFPQRTMDILERLRCSLETKGLQHFVIGNERFPTEIPLPSDLRLAEPPNLLQQLASDPDAHAKALQGYFGLVHGLKQVLLSGH